MKNPFDNPVYRLDLRSRVREKRLWALALFFVSVPAVLWALVLPAFLRPPFSGRTFPDCAKALSAVAVFSHGALLVLLSALGAAQRISQERERRTLAALVNSPIPARSVALGKLLGAWTFSAWLACLSLPFLAAATLWGGFRAPTLFAAWLLNLAAAFAAASLALGLSGLFGRSLSAYLATGASLFLWCAALPVTGILAAALRDADRGGSDAAGLVGVLCWFHVPLVPQGMIFLPSETPIATAVATALVVWSAISAAGFALAVRGLGREVC